MLNEFSLVLLTQVPFLIGAFFSFLLGYFFGRVIYRKSGHLGYSYTIALSLFLILCFLVPSLIMMPIMLVLGEGAQVVIGIFFMVTAQYSIWIQFVTKIALSYWLYTLIKRIVPQSRGELTKYQVIMAYFFGIVALVSILLPLFRLYENYKISAKMDAQLSAVHDEVRDEVKTQTSQIISALDKFFANNKKYPETLDELVPEYLDKVPLAPRASPYEYDPNITLTDYRLCAYTDEGKSCRTLESDWTATRPWCSYRTEKPVGVDCQFRHDPEPNDY